MTEQWLGLHNPERHTTFASSGGAATCSRETGWCTPERPCGCCMDEEARRLKAEVEALRAQVQAVRDAKWKHPAPTDGTPWEGWNAAWDVVTRALDGGDA